MMAKKRKSDATPFDDLDRSMYSTFSTAANSLSQLYSQSMTHQRLSFRAGERHALEKLYQWILKPQEGGARLSVADIVAYLQDELESGPEEPSTSPRMQGQLQHHQTGSHGNHFGVPVSSNTLSGQGLRFGHLENQSKSSIFSNALSSPVRRSLQHYHPAPAASVRTCDSQNREFPNSPISGDSMDI